MVKIKICGITNLDDALFVASTNINAIGFVIETPTNSPRNISRSIVSSIIARLPPLLSTVGVIIPKTIAEALSIIKDTNVQVIQIHGDIEPDILNEIKALNIQTVRCLGINEGSNLEELISQVEILKQYKVDAILLDTKVKRGTGGTGKTHNWALSAELRHSFEIPFILAGGLTPDNITKAIEKVNPYAIDISSGIESQPGKKDHNKIRELLQKVREVS